MHPLGGSAAKYIPYILTGPSLSQHILIDDVFIDVTQLSAEYLFSYEGDGHVGAVGNYTAAFQKWNVYVRDGRCQVEYPTATLDFSGPYSPWPCRIYANQTPNGCTINGEYKPWTAAGYMSDLVVYVHGRTGSNPGGKRYYWIKLRMGDDLVRDLVPAVHNGWVGLRDKVTGKFYTSNYADAWIYGNEPV